MQSLLGQRLAADINLAAQILILIGLWIGFAFARRKQIQRHRVMQTTMVAVNSFFILFFMVTSFYLYVIAGGTTTGPIASLMIIHGFLGLAAELTGIYLILRMTTNLIPPGLRVRNFKPVMRSLLGLWTVIVVLGFGIYTMRYLASKPPPAANPLVSVVHAVDDIQIHTDEMSTAIQRGNLQTAKRHAEHVINLIVGKNSVDYGDVDGDGVVEDPGDGTGAIVYLNNLRKSAGQNGGASAILDQMQTSILRIAADAKAVAQSQDTRGMSQVVGDAVSQAAGLREGQDASINRLAQALGAQVVRPTVAVAGPALSGPSTVTVTMQNFSFNPQKLTVKQGTTIVFINHDAAKHTVTSDTGKFNSGDINSGQSYTLKLDEPGVYPYYCLFHGDKGGVDMAGTIEVTP